jgi:8-oxo-dGTP diphosphatase
MAKKTQFCYDYPRPALTADCIIIRRKKDQKDILLIERAHEPFKGFWALPGGFTDINESSEETAKRELKEETGIDSNNLQQVHTFSDPGRDPRGRTVSVVYYAEIEDSEINPTAGDDASKAAWFSINALPELAFDHFQIIEFTIHKLGLSI